MKKFKFYKKKVIVRNKIATIETDLINNATSETLPRILSKIESRVMQQIEITLDQDNYIDTKIEDNVVNVYVVRQFVDYILEEI